MKKKRKRIIREVDYNPNDWVPKKWMKTRNRILWKIKQTKKYDGTIKCPHCKKNKIHYSMETGSGNYSYHARCKTKDCFNIFESGHNEIGR